MEGQKFGRLCPFTLVWTWVYITYRWRDGHYSERVLTTMAQVRPWHSKYCLSCVVAGGRRAREQPPRMGMHDSIFHALVGVGKSRLHHLLKSSLCSRQHYNVVTHIFRVHCCYVCILRLFSRLFLLFLVLFFFSFPLFYKEEKTTRTSALYRKKGPRGEMRWPDGREKGSMAIQLSWAEGSAWHGILDDDDEMGMSQHLDAALGTWLYRRNQRI